MNFTIKEKYWVLADQVVVSGAGFATNLFLARTLGLVEYGKFSAIVMVQLFLLSITMSFSSQVYQVVYPALSPMEKKKLTNGMLGQQLMVATVFFTLMLLILSVLSANNITWPRQSRTLLFIAGSTTVLYLLQDFLRRLFIAQVKGKQAFVIDSITNTLQLAALVAVWYFSVLTQVKAWLIIGFTFVPSIVAAFTLLRPGRFSTEAMGFSWNLQKNKSGWLVGSSLLQWAAGYFFVIAAGWWVGAAALGALRLAQYLFGLLNLLLQAIESYVMQKAASFKENQQAYWWQLLKKCLLLVLPFLALFSLFAKQILQLAGGPEFIKYTFVVYGLSIIYVLVTVGYPVRIAIRSLHLNKHYFIAYILSMFFSLSSAPWLLHNWGLYGVLTGLFTTQVITVGYWLIILKRKNQFLWKSSI